MKENDIFSNMFQEIARNMEKEAANLMKNESYGKWAETVSEMNHFSGDLPEEAVSSDASPKMQEQIESPFYFLENMGEPAMGMLNKGVQPFDILDPSLIMKLANKVFKESSETASLHSSGNESSLYFMKNHISAPVSGDQRSVFNVEAIRRDFPILHRKVNGKPLVWLDNGATTQKPQIVIDRVSYYYEYENSNVHRGAHSMAANSTDAYEKARKTIARFIGARSPEEIVFVRGTTEGINMLASICAEKNLSAGDEILLTEAEHHANIVPWQFAVRQTGATIKVIPVNMQGEIDLEEYARLLTPRTKVVSITHVSNVLGTIMPIEQMTQMAKRYGAMVIIDGAQGIPHRRVNVEEIGCDFYVFSGHKLFGPTGIGAVYGRKERWDEMPPWQGGGSMITRVSFDQSSFAQPPYKFEAGTGSLASAVGMGTAIEYVSGIGIDSIEQYETRLLNYALEKIMRINGIRMIGMPHERGGVISFVLKGIDDMAVAKALDAEGIAVRSGHHCAQPILKKYGLESCVRPAFAFYNTFGEADLLADTLKKIASKQVTF